MAQATPSASLAGAMWRAARNDAPGWVDLLLEIDDPDLLYRFGLRRSIYYFPTPEVGM
jgi:hypothetical protein